MNKNLTLKMGNCNHRAYIPELIGYMREGLIDPGDEKNQQHVFVRRAFRRGPVRPRHRKGAGFALCRVGGIV